MTVLTRRILSMVLTLCLCLAMLPTVAMKAEAAAYDNTHTNTGNQAHDIVAVAQTQVGYQEGANNDNKYGAAFGHNNVEWCAYFVSWCAKEAGISDSIIHRQGIASPFSGYFNIPNTHSSGNYFPKPGDLVFYGPNSNGDHYHVGIVETVNASTGYITTIEGNTNSGGSSEGYIVYRHTRHYQYSNICCYGTPNYTNTSITHTVDNSYGTNFSAYPKAKITAENIFDAYHNQVDSSSWIGTADKCTIHEVYTDGCCKVTYPLDAGGTKTVYSKISLFNTHTHSYTGARTYENAHPHRISQRCVDYATCGGWTWTDEYYELKTCEQCWHADFDIGASSISVKVGESKTVSATVSGCLPDSAVLYRSFSPDNDVVEVTIKNQQATFTGLMAGTTSFSLTVYSDSSKSHVIGTITIPVTVFNTHTHSYTGARAYENAHPHRISQRCVDYATCGGWTWTDEYYELKTCEQCWHADFDIGASSISVKVGESKTVSATVSGCLPDSAVLYRSFSPDNDVVEVTIKNQQATFTGLMAGTTSFSLTVYSDSSKSHVIGTITIPVTVTAQTYTVSYNANGGIGAPSDQTKYHGTSLTLSTTKPTLTGYTFLGWSISSTATSATYQPGDSYSENSNITLYAVWKKGCESNSHSYSFKVSKTPTTSATGTLTATCSKCSGTTTVTLPKLNTTDYSYNVIKDATCTAVGTGRYTWNTTTYGTFTFDVSLAKTGHSYSYKATKNPTTSAAGTLTGTCSKCSGTTTVTLPKLNTTDYSYSVVKAATCTAAGTGRYTWNTTTYGTFIFDVTLPKTGHTEVTDKAVSATCTATGKTEGSHCSVCSTVIKAQEVIPTKGHTEVTDKAVSATCTATGKTEGSHCSVCNTVIKAQETVAALGHNYKAKVTVPTCAKKGYTTYTCSRCGDSYKDDYKDATGKHTYANDEDADCDVCGYTRQIRVETTPMYRLYNPNTGEHFYTGSIEERDNLDSVGWNYEGIGWYAPIKGGDPVYRVYNPNSGDHHYTMSWQEVQNLVDVGWNYEGVAWNSASSDKVPQFRLYNPNADLGSHHYTSSLVERDNLVSIGWRLEGIGWFGYDSQS